MRAVNFLSAVAALIILATSASGECESENIPVEVQTESETRPIKRTVAEFAEMAQGDYTGLVIDCRGLGLKTAMSPVVKNANGTKIYGHKNLDVDK